MIDVKKLITGFLVLAIAGSVSALIVNGTGNLRAANSAAIAGTAAQPTPAPGNAFLLMFLRKISQIAGGSWYGLRPCTRIIDDVLLNDRII